MAKELELEHWTLLLNSGRARPYGSFQRIDRASTFYSLLDNVYNEFQSAGSNWDSPRQLMINGLYYILDRSLTDYAWDWGKAKTAAMEAAVKATRADFNPEWLRETPNGE